MAFVHPCSGGWNRKIVHFEQIVCNEIFVYDITITLLPLLY
jgi:hypothetical protein